MLPKKGKSFPNREKRNDDSYSLVLAEALHRHLGASHRATKTVMGWTGASERTVKHWLSGRHGPRGGHLVAVLRHSDIALAAILELAGRSDLTVNMRVADILARLRDAVTAIEGLKIDARATKE